MDIRELMKNQIVILDGAMGTMLKEKGLDIKKKPEIFNFLNEDIIIDIHRQYIEAGANVIVTNTFGANDIRLEGGDYSVEDIIFKAVELAKKSKGNKEDVYIALDIGPTGVGVEPLGKLTNEEAYNIFKKQVDVALKCGVDLILIETVINFDEAKMAIKAVKDNSSLPIFCTVTLKDFNKTFDNKKVDEVFYELNKLELNAVGINCAPGVKGLYKVIEKISGLLECPIIVKPNTKGSKGDIFLDEYVNEILKCVEAGATIIGGCCGTNPEYIKKIKNRIKN